MGDEHSELHSQCGQFEKELREFLRTTDSEAAHHDTAVFASSVAYVRMKAIEMEGHFKAFAEAVSATDLSLVRDRLLDIQTDMDFLCQEGDEVRARIVGLINYLECLAEEDGGFSV